MPKSWQPGYDRKVTEFAEISVTILPKRVKMAGLKEKDADFARGLENNLLQKCNYFQKRGCNL